MCMNCVSQSLPYVAMALGGLQLPRLLGRTRGTTPDDDGAVDPAGADERRPATDVMPAAPAAPQPAARHES